MRASRLSGGRALSRERSDALNDLLNIHPCRVERDRAGRRAQWAVTARRIALVAQRLLGEHLIRIAARGLSRSLGETFNSESAPRQGS